MTAVVPQSEPKQNPIVALITSPESRKYIAPFLPKDVDIERVAASVLIAIQNDKTRTLGKCTPQSLVLGVARIQQWGLELGVTAYLLPFANKVTVYDEEQKRDVEKKQWEATPVADYKGLAELMIASGAVRYIEARVVYDGDEFEYRLGLDPILNHLPTQTRSERGAITHAYCVVQLPMGRRAFEVMSAGDIDEIRQRYSKQWKNGPLPAWYAKKTVVRQTAKLLPKNPALSRFFAVLAQDRVEEMGVEVDATPGAPRLIPLSEPDDEDEVMPPDGREPGDEEEYGHTPPF